MSFLKWQVFDKIVETCHRFYKVLRILNYRKSSMKSIVVLLCTISTQTLNYNRPCLNADISQQNVLALVECSGSFEHFRL